MEKENKVQGISKVAEPLRSQEDAFQLAWRNRGLIGKIIKSLRIRSQDYNDAWQEGFLALTRAALYWNPQKSKITTYGWWAIYNAVLSWRCKNSCVPIPSYCYRLKIFLPDVKQLKRHPIDYDRDNNLDEAMKVRRVLDGLPESYRQVLTMRFFYCWTLKAIGEYLGVSKQAVLRKEDRALKWFRREWTKNARNN